jgi:uncharacterized protein
MEEIRIPVAGGLDVSASLEGGQGTLVALAHGAGGDRRTGLLLRASAALAASGRRALVYNFPYSEAGRRAPDPPPRLEATAAAVARHAREALRAGRVVLGGKSMGGRIASQAVAKGAPADALVFLGYPLHPPGRTSVLRDQHLAGIRVPMLFLQGTRDAFARWDLIEAATRRLGERASLHRVEDADHSYRVLKRTGRSASEVEQELFQVLLGWLAARGL